MRIRNFGKQTLYLIHSVIKLLLFSQDGSVDKYEFPRSKIKIIRRLDSGAFGQVFLAKILCHVDGKRIPDVAIKTLRGKSMRLPVPVLLFSKINYISKFQIKTIFLLFPSSHLQNFIFLQSHFFTVYFRFTEQRKF